MVTQKAVGKFNMVILSAAPMPIRYSLLTIRFS